MLARRIMSIWTLLAAAGAAAPAAAQTPIPGAVAPPSGWVNGLTLTVRESNFAVDAPAASWQWLQVPPGTSPRGTTMLVCVHAETNAFIVVGSMAMDARDGGEEEFTRGFMNGVRKSAGANWTFTNEIVEKSDFPQAGSLRFALTAHNADHGTFYARGYLLRFDRAYLVQEFSQEPAETPALRSIATSFRLLEPRSARPRIPTGVLLLGVLAVPWALCAGINVLVGRPLINGALVGGCLVAAGLVAVLATAPSPTPYQLGRRIGEALLPLIIATWGAARFNRKKAGAPPPLRMP